MKYTTKWTFIRSRFVFIIKVILKWLKGKPSLLYSGGVHLITGVSGSGKTLLMNIILQVLLNKDGFAWSNMDEFFHKRVKVFDFDEIFKDGEQQKRLNKVLTIDGVKHHWKAVVFDELNAKFNRRMNRATEYNDRFIPLIKFTVTHRHQGVDRVYFIGQSMLLQDGQIQSVLKVRHDVRASKRWRYYFYREKNVMLYLPKKLIVTHYINEDVDGDGNIIWKKLLIPTKVRVLPSDFETFDTHAFAKLTDHLPEYIHP